MENDKVDGAAVFVGGLMLAGGLYVAAKVLDAIFGGPSGESAVQPAVSLLVSVPVSEVPVVRSPVPDFNQPSVEAVSA
ncbi:MAG: hypothetical protein KGJ93_05130, partial [Patescibacteria group bacterium]|nr:hypothetical protein [Patescibacteria group bacterium]